jgi:hypothetical protein
LLCEGVWTALKMDESAPCESSWTTIILGGGLRSADLPFDTSFRDPEEISDHGERNPRFVLVTAKHVAREGNLIAVGAWIHEIFFM